MKQARKPLSHGVAPAHRRRPLPVGSSDVGAYRHRRLETTARSMVLDERLTNWANVSSGRRGDARDAALIDAAWQRVSPEHRMLLRMHYVWHANRAFICRRLKIRHRPWHVFEDELEQAKAEVAEALVAAGRRT